jgi:murein L,D-transpeptidase YcbB/YkuD
MAVEEKTRLENREEEFQQRELDLKEGKLRMKEAEAAGPSWRNPVFLGLMAAALSLLGNLIATSLQNWNTQRVERYKAQSNLILEAIKTGDQEKAAKNLSFFLQLGFLDDDHGKIRDFLTKGSDVPVLPASSPTAPGPALSVREAKLALTKLGLFAGTPDAQYTEAFRDALKKFQQAHGLPPDGTLGPATANALAPLVPEVPASSLQKGFGAVR